MSLKILCALTTCTNSGTLVCTRCRCLSYCSQECQRAHYPLHRAFCLSRYSTRTQAANSTRGPNSNAGRTHRSERASARERESSYSMVILPPPFIILDDSSYASILSRLSEGLEHAISEGDVVEDAVLRADGRVYGRSSGRLVLSDSLRATYSQFGMIRPELAADTRA